MIPAPFWLTICGGVIQTASAVYVVVALCRHIRRTETETGKLRAVIATHMQTVEGHLVELLQLHGRVEDLEHVVFGDRR